MSLGAKGKILFVFGSEILRHCAKLQPAAELETVVVMQTVAELQTAAELQTVVEFQSVEALLNRKTFIPARLGLAQQCSCLQIGSKIHFSGNLKRFALPHRAATQHQVSQTWSQSFLLYHDVGAASLGCSMKLFRVSWLEATLECWLGRLLITPAT